MALRDAARGGAMPSSGSTSSIRRIQKELKEISEDPSRHWTASPVGDDLFEWQFAIRGPPGTDYEGGIYTGRLVLPVNYPLAPPSIMLLTPNGRWEVGKKICLSNSNYHPELWQPAWGIRTMMEALRSHFPINGEGAIGALDWPSDLRKQLAKESLDFVCPPSKCPNRELLPELTPEEMREELPIHHSFPEIAPEAAVDAAAAEPAAPTDVPTATDSCAISGDGLRFRGSPAAVQPAAEAPMSSIPEPSAAAASSAQAPHSPPPAGVAPGLPQASAVPAASSSEGRERRRREDGARPQRRQRPILAQLIKPPESRREWVIILIDVLIVLATVCFCGVLIDIFRNPPKLLNPLPEARDPQL